MDANKRRWIAAVILILYSAVLIQFVVFKAIPDFHIGHRIYRFGGTNTGPSNFVPFRTIATMLHQSGNKLWARANVYGNIVPFMPIGFLAAFLYKKFTWTSALIVSIAVGLLMETMEYIFQVGIVDIDDVILNALGVLLGYAAHRAIFGKSV